MSTQKETPPPVPVTAPVDGVPIPGDSKYGTTPPLFTVSMPPVGLYMTAEHRYYFNGAGPYPSVTTILDVMDKQALLWWVKHEVAKFAMQVCQTGELMAQLAQFGAEATEDWLASSPDAKRDAAGSIGTSVHLLANMLGRGESDSTAFPMPEGTQPYLEAWRGFLGRYSASSIVSSEKAVMHFGMGYGGTYDLIMLIDGQLWLIDIKTGKGPRLTKATEASGAYYPEVALQLAGYGYAEAIVLPNDPTLYPMPLIQRYGVLHLRPDRYPDTGWRLIEYTVTERTFSAFVSAWDLYRWKKGE